MTDTQILLYYMIMKIMLNYNCVFDEYKNSINDGDVYKYMIFKLDAYKHRHVCVFCDNIFISTEYTNATRKTNANITRKMKTIYMSDPEFLEKLTESLTEI